ncbi:MAG: hypothetical protein V7752_17770 [Halopseudomonas sp.]
MKHKDCLGEYDFERIAAVAKKRFVDGIDTITLMEQAKTTREKEEVVLIALLNVDDKQIQQIQLCCPYELTCHVIDCQQRLKKLLQRELKENIEPVPS